MNKPKCLNVGLAEYMKLEDLLKENFEKICVKNVDYQLLTFYRKNINNRSYFYQPTSDNKNVIYLGSYPHKKD